MSRTQIDRLGDRLKREQVEADLRLLDQYRRSFSDAYDTVVSAIRRNLSLEPTGRRAKSTAAIIDKLRRESIRLSQIQDIAGCRLLVADVPEQDRVVASLCVRSTTSTLADVSDPALKYGGGDPATRQLLSDLSRMVEEAEKHDIPHRL